MTIHNPAKALIERVMSVLFYVESTYELFPSDLFFDRFQSACVKSNLDSLMRLLEEIDGKLPSDLLASGLLVGKIGRSDKEVMLLALRADQSPRFRGLKKVRRTR